MRPSLSSCMLYCDEKIFEWIRQACELRDHRKQKPGGLEAKCILMISCYCTGTDNDLEMGIRI